MDYGLSAFFIIAAYILGWVWGEEVRDYFRRRRMRLGISDRLAKVTYMGNYE